MPAGPGDFVWHDDKGGIVAVLGRGDRVYSVEALAAPPTAACSTASKAHPTSSSASARKRSRSAQMIDRLLEADLVCIGETHDSELTHMVQLQIIKALFARDERLGVGMEMFQRPFQNHIDRYCKGECTEEEFLKGTEYKQRWGFDWGLYRPIVEFCRKNSVPVAALNVPRELTKRISAVGHAALTDAEKEQLGDIDFQVKPHRDYWYERLAKMHGQKDVKEEQKERSYQVMTTWDEYMGDSAARFQKERALRRLVVLAGTGHIDRGFGIPAARRQTHRRQDGDDSYQR